MSTSGVCGVVCTDLRGLVLVEKTSTGDSLHAGAVSSIAMLANKLLTDQTPVICVEGEKRNCLIRTEDKIVLGVFKDKV